MVVSPCRCSTPLGGFHPSVGESPEGVSTQAGEGGRGNVAKVSRAMGGFERIPSGVTRKQYEERKRLGLPIQADCEKVTRWI